MIILFGMAGSGKGTQGKALSEIFGWRWISVGQVLRETGKYKALTDAGELVPDDEVIRLMNERIMRDEAEGFDVILDGYPRDVAQAEWLAENMAEKIDGAIILEVPEDELMERLALRGRDDDKSQDAIQQRFEVYKENIAGILPILERKNVKIRRISGMGAVEEVTARLVDCVKEICPDATEQIDDVNGGEIERSYGE